MPLILPVTVLNDRLFRQSKSPSIIVCRVGVIAVAEDGALLDFDLLKNRDAAISPADRLIGADGKSPKRFGDVPGEALAQLAAVPQGTPRGVTDPVSDEGAAAVALGGLLWPGRLGIRAESAVRGHE